MKDKAKEYFEAFSNKDLEALEEMYHEDVSLRDWLTSADGRDKVLESNKRLFDACSSVEITLSKEYPSSDGSACEIDINVVHNDGTEDKLLVVDVIDFKEGKIKEIRAYLGNV